MKTNQTEIVKMALSAMINNANIALQSLELYEYLSMSEDHVKNLSELMSKLKMVSKSFEVYAKSILPLKELCRQKALHNNVERGTKVKAMLDVSGVTFSAGECYEPCIRDLVREGNLVRATESLLDLAGTDIRWSEYFKDALNHNFGSDTILLLLDEFVVHSAKSDVFFNELENLGIHGDDIAGCVGEWD